MPERVASQTGCCKGPVPCQLSKMFNLFMVAHKERQK